MVHIDGDICVYAVASACEGKRWRYKGVVYDSKIELNKLLKQDGVDDSAVESFSEPEEWVDCQTSAISYIENIINHCEDDYRVYLSGKSNFRYEVATIKPYKGNRSSEKPVHFDAVRQFYKDYYDAIVTVRMEADDAIGLAHDPDTDIIATRDKDLNCIPGLHYDWVKGSCSFITEDVADLSFYSQLLTGDSTDNILGLYGVSKESKLLKNLQDLKTNEERLQYVRSQYESRFGSYADTFLSETCNLVWILQKRTPYWSKWFAQRHI